MTAPADQIASAGAYPEWKAPAGDSQRLIWPEPGRLLADTRRNQSLLGAAHGVRLLGMPLPELRRRARRWLGYSDDARPLLLTGHQTELWHPGVWVKNVVVDAAARKLGGSAVHVAVDTDVPKHLLLRWSGGEMPITDDPRVGTSAWAGLLASPSPAHLHRLGEALRRDAAGWSFEPEVYGFLDRLGDESVPKDAPDRAPAMSDAIRRALCETDRALGLAYHAVAASPIWDSPAFHAFAAYVLANAGRFADDYNAALRDYRDAHGLVTDRRPMPDLFVSVESVELPFWQDQVREEHRVRPSVFAGPGDTWVLKLVSGEEYIADPSEPAERAADRLGRFLAGTSHRLSPRALMLTMFLRLMVADQFVHGIGGGRYDQVLDRLIARHFRLRPPAFSVATATMRFPSAVGRERACVTCVVHEGRRLRHAVLGLRKRDLVEAIAAQPRQSRGRALGYSALQTELRQAWQASPQRHAWEARLDAVRAQAAGDAVEFDRELFYAIQPRARLEGLIAGVRQAFEVG